MLMELVNFFILFLNIINKWSYFLLSPQKIVFVKKKKFNTKEVDRKRATNVIHFLIILVLNFRKTLLLCVLWRCHGM